MTPTLLTLALLLPAADAGGEARKPNMLAPSLPLLTDDEEAKLDQIVDRFIKFDTGGLTGKEGQKALADFHNLGPEATFALVRGLSKSADIEASCPAVVIGKKLLTVIRTSHDAELMEYLRENVGLGVVRSRHMGVIKDLKLEATVRKRQLAASGRKGPPEMVALRPIEPPAEDRFVVVKPRGEGGEKKTAALGSAELTRLAGVEKGDRLKEILTELATRPASEALAPLARAAGDDSPSEVRYLAQELLVKNLTRLPGASLKDRLKDERPAVRLAAAKVAGDRRLRHGDELIALLADKDAEVRQAAHDALALIGGVDHGPTRTANQAERSEAAARWRAWWVEQGAR